MPELGKLSQMDRDSSLILLEIFVKHVAASNPILFVAVLNILSELTSRNSIDWFFQKYLRLPPSACGVLARTMPLTITKLKLNDSLLDGDALMQALSQSPKRRKITCLKIRRSNISRNALNMLSHRCFRSLRVLDISHCAVLGAEEIVATNCRKLKTLYIGWSINHDFVTTAAGSHNSRCVLLFLGFRFRIPTLFVSSSTIAALSKMSSQGNSLVCPRLVKLRLFGLPIDSKDKTLEAFFQAREGVLSNFSQRRNHAHGGDFCDFRKYCASNAIQCLSLRDELVKPKYSALRRLTFYFCRRIMDLPVTDPVGFTQLKTVQFHNMEANSLLVDLSFLPALKRVIITQGAGPNGIVFPVSLRSLYISNIHSSEISVANWMEAFYDLMEKRQNPLDFLQLHNLTVGSRPINGKEREYVGHKIRALSLSHIFYEGQRFPYDLHLVVNSPLGGLVPPHTQAKVPALFYISGELQALFPRPSKVGFGVLSAPETAQVPLYFARIINAEMSFKFTEIPFRTLRELIVEPRFSTPLHFPEKWDELVPHLLGLTFRAPSAHKATSIPVNLLSHRTVSTVRIYWKGEALVVDGVRLPRLRSISIDGMIEEIRLLGVSCLVESLISCEAGNLKITEAHELLRLVSDARGDIRIQAPKLELFSQLRSPKSVQFSCPPANLAAISITCSNVKSLYQFLQDCLWKRSSSSCECLRSVELHLSGRTWDEMDYKLRPQLSQQYLDRAKRVLCSVVGAQLANPLRDHFPHLESLRAGDAIWTVSDQGVESISISQDHIVRLFMPDEHCKLDDDPEVGFFSKL